MSLYKYKPDAKKREAGILVEIDSRGDYPEARVVKKVGALPTFVLANATDQNPIWDSTFERLMRPYRDADAKSDKSDESKRELAEMFLEAYRQAFAEAALRGWHNVTFEDGKPREFSKTEALALLTEIPEVYDRLVTVAQDRRNFRIDPPGNPDADAKNS